MFGRMMNNYYYGKSGKGDFRKEDLPQNRRQLFLDTLKTRLSALCRINLMYMIIFLPAMLVMMFFFTNIISDASNLLMMQENDYASYVELMKESEQEVQITEEHYNELKNSVNAGDLMNNSLFRMLVWLIPCLAITGPFTAGLSYVTRNWARDEHAFIWTDFKDAVKENWKQSLILSVITSILPLAAYVGWEFYGNLSAQNIIMIIPQVLVVLAVFIWAISITYMHPLTVTYTLKTKDIIRNGLLLGVARLPMSVGIRLLHCVPALIGAALIWFWNPMIGMLILFAYYALIGFAVSRFITASYTNAVFDRFINPRIEGAKVNQGLYTPDEDEEDEEEETAEGDSNN
ncbi:MAG: YesL family protein [Clostridia bacterium]|nr:YesL family protein [Clostridia bacterium]